MIRNIFSNNRVLIAVAHNDDIEFIAGGLLNSYSKQIAEKQIELLTITFASREQNTLEEFDRTIEYQTNAFKRLQINPVTSFNERYRARFLPDFEDHIRLRMKDIRNAFDPNIVITHYQGDPNQDHQSVAMQVMRVFSDRTILGGEISNTGKRLKPNFFVGLDRDNILAKYESLQNYRAEAHKYYFKFELIESLARVRAGQSGCFEYAEAFELYSLHCR